MLPTESVAAVWIIWEHPQEQCILPKKCVVAASGGRVMGSGPFNWYTVGPLMAIERCLNARAYLNIAASDDAFHLNSLRKRPKPVKTLVILQWP
uniref:Uncharacterized protein n=1 Tax=Cyclopterus lumpus TaxID=8103 RepID=A0A8C2WQQ2_CYCLU